MGALVRLPSFPRFVYRITEWSLDTGAEYARVTLTLEYTVPPEDQSIPLFPEICHA